MSCYTPLFCPSVLLGLFVSHSSSILAHLLCALGGAVPMQNTPVNGALVPFGFGLGLVNGRHWQENTRCKGNEVGSLSLVLFASSRGLGSVSLLKAVAPIRQPSPCTTFSGNLKQWSHFPSYLQEVIALTSARLGIFSHPFLIHFNPPFLQLYRVPL